MSTLHSTTKFPPKGWIFRVMIAGRYWTVPDPMLPFDEVVKGIVRVHEANKVKLSIEQATQMLADFTCKRLDNDTRWCVGKVASGTATAEAKVKGCAGCGRKRRQ
jgi:hypothetical protein